MQDCSDTSGNRRSTLHHRQLTDGRHGDVALQAARLEEAVHLRAGLAAPAQATCSYCDSTCGVTTSGSVI